MPRLNGKFVSQAAYDAAVSNGETIVIPTKQENPVSEETVTRNVSPLVLATREVTKTKARLDKAQAAADKQTSVEVELTEALAAYEAATKTLTELL